MRCRSSRLQDCCEDSVRRELVESSSQPYVPRQLVRHWLRHRLERRPRPSTHDRHGLGNSVVNSTLRFVAAWCSQGGYSRRQLSRVGPGLPNGMRKGVGWATLLCLSRGECWRRRVFEESPDSSCDVALEAADDFSFGLAFRESTGHVRACRRVSLEPGDSDDVERVVHPSVPSTIEAVTVLCLSGCRRDGGGAGESSERSFVAAATVMRPRQHKRRRRDFADAGLAEQLGRDLSKQRRHCSVVIGDFVVEMCDALREGTHGQLGALLGDRSRS